MPGRDQSSRGRKSNKGSRVSKTPNAVAGSSYVQVCHHHRCRDLAVRPLVAGVTPFPAAFTRKWFRRTAPASASESAARVRPWCCCMASALRVICGPPGNCSGQGPYRDSSPTCAAWVCPTTRIPATPRRTRRRHCRVMDATQGQNAIWSHMNTATWSLCVGRSISGPGHALV